MNDLPSALQAFSGGVLIGLASWLLLAAIGRVAGISGIVASALVPTKNEKTIDGLWRWVFVIGLVVGGGLTSLWIETPSVVTRPVWLLVTAGLLVGVGTVVGSGCTSGHGVCGIGRRSMRSLVATLVFMAAGALTVFVFQSA